jgi:hypothetical protein
LGLILCGLKKFKSKFKEKNLKKQKIEGQSLKEAIITSSLIFTFSYFSKFFKQRKNLLNAAIC